MSTLKRLLAPALLAVTLGLTGPTVAPLWAQEAGAQDTATHGEAAGAAEGTEPAAEAAGDHAEGAEAGGHNAPIPFFSLYNTNFVVLLAFLAFVAVLIYLKVPGKVTAMLDSRATNIRKELDEARKLREEAQALLASYERKSKEAREQVDRIVGTAKSEAASAAEKAKDDIKKAIARRLASAEDQIASAQASAIREVKNRAAEIAVEVAGEALAKQMDAARANALIDDAIETVQAKLH